MYVYAVHKFNPGSITRKYLIHGHTLNKGDNAYSDLEKQIKRHSSRHPIYISDHCTFKKTGKSYKVRELEYNTFCHLTSLQDEWGTIFSQMKITKKQVRKG